MHRMGCVALAGLVRVPDTSSLPAQDCWDWAMLAPLHRGQGLEGRGQVLAAAHNMKRWERTLTAHQRQPARLGGCGSELRLLWSRCSSLHRASSTGLLLCSLQLKSKSTLVCGSRDGRVGQSPADDHCPRSRITRAAGHTTCEFTVLVDPHIAGLGSHDDERSGDRNSIL